MDAELKAKQDAKYDPAVEAEVVGWIEALLGADCAKGDQPVHEWLKSGEVLCHLINAIKPDTIRKVNTVNAGAMTAPFKARENIKYFINAASEMSVPQSSLFDASDLYDEKNMGAVMMCIYALGGVVQVDLPDIGPKCGIPISVASHNRRPSMDQAPQRGRLSVPGADAARAASPRPASSAGSSAGGATHTPSPRPSAARTPSPRPAGEGACDQELVDEVVKWVEDIVGADQAKGDQSVHEWLKSGQVLCHLLNAIKPGTVEKVNTVNAPFKQMENITFFMKGARAFGVPEYAMFGVPDLYEEKNMDSVTKCLFFLGGAIQKSVPGFRGPKLGIAMRDVKDEKREKGLVNLADGFRGAMDVSYVNAMQTSHVRKVRSQGKLDWAPTEGKTSALAIAEDDGEGECEGDHPEDAELFEGGELSPVASEVDEEEWDPALVTEIDILARKMNPEMAIGIVVGLLRWKRKSLERVPAFDPPSRVDEEGGDVVPELAGLLKNRKPLPKGATRTIDLDAGGVGVPEPEKPKQVGGLILKKATNVMGKWQSRCFVLDAGRMQYFSTEEEANSGIPRAEYDLLGAAVAFVDTKEKDQFEVVLRGSKRKPYLFQADIRMFTKRKGGGDSQGYTRGHWVHAFEEHISYAKSLAAYHVATGRCFDQDK